MIDTIKLSIKLTGRPPDTVAFEPDLASIRPDHRGVVKAVRNPSAASKKIGKYEPRITYYERPNGIRYELIIELSLPKLLRNNNFDELTNDDFPEIITKLRERLREIGIWVFGIQLANAQVKAIHFSKNFVFKDYTSVSSILNMLRAADVSRVYDVQKTDFREGHVLHLHCNSLDVVGYDKLADMRQSKISEKRSVEKDNYVQLDLFKQFEISKPLSIFRFEIRLNGLAKIKQVFQDQQSIVDSGYSFESLFSSELSREVLLAFWDKFFGKLPLIQQDYEEPHKILANILLLDDLKGPTQALARLGMLLLLKESNTRHLRTLFENRFGKHVWNRLKSLSVMPEKRQFKTLIQLRRELESFIPTQIDQVRNQI